MRTHVLSDLWLDCDNRLAEAHWRLHDRANAIDSWFALCHLAPEVFERVIEAADFLDWALQTAWRVALEQDFEPEMTREWFPAWVLLEELGFAAALAPRRTDDDPSRAFDATMSLLAHPSLDGHGIELRRSLQASHPGLLGRFLAKRARPTAPVPLLGKKTGTAEFTPPALRPVTPEYDRHSPASLPGPLTPVTATPRFVGAGFQLHSL